MATFARDGGAINVNICGTSRGEGNHVAIDVDSLTSSIENMMSQNLRMSDKCCIYRVPHILRRHSEKAYLPNAFSIGPWHYNNPLLRETEKIKLNYLKGLLSQSQITLKELIEAIGKIEKEARECYAEPVEVSVEDFVKILVIDGCFLIELFRKVRERKLREDDDPIFNISCMMQYLSHDLVLIENQLPWFVLERLFEMAVGSESKPLAELALHFFAVDTFSFRNSFEVPPSHELEKKHLLDLLTNWLVWLSEKKKDIPVSEEDVESEWKPMPCVTDLVDAGIKLTVADKSKGILDIEFRNGVLEIPSLLIHETTEVIIRNLISYEQCCPKCTDRITSYARTPRQPH